MNQRTSSSKGQEAAMKALLVGTFWILAMAVTGCGHEQDVVKLRPVIEGEWWQVAGNPNLGEYTSEKQEPVDFSIWQAEDGTWQLWSCIRHTNCGGNTRLFYRWEGSRLTDRDWKPMGISMEADPAYGEQPGGLQSPYVFEENGLYYLFYGDWERICLAQSSDGKNFERLLNESNGPGLFSGPYRNTRDPMTLKSKETYYCYYTGHLREVSAEEHKAAVFARKSKDLLSWGEPVMVSAGGWAKTQPRWFGGDCECPFVAQFHGLYYLFRNQRYGENNLNTQFASADPLDFGVDDDRCMVGTLPVAAPEIIEYEGQHYVAALMPSLNGIRIARLGWEKVPQN
jgi:hypothetical protein